MDNDKFRYRKTTRRNDFTTIFGGVGSRRDLRSFTRGGKGRLIARFKMQMHRRAAQGDQNKIFGRLTAMKLRLQFGIRKSVRRFRL
jgi:hypothetical protein